MPKRQPEHPISHSQNCKKSTTANFAEFETSETDDFTEYVFIPNSNESDIDDNESNDDEVDSDEEDNDKIYFPSQSYKRISESYNTAQKKLEQDHEYNWVNGEKIYNDTLTNKILLTEKQKQQILSYSHVELFEQYFSNDVKQYIIDATAENEYTLTPNRFDVFLGVLIFSAFNKRLSQRDFWSKNPLLRAEPVAAAMGQREFEQIKSHIKYSLPTDEDKNDRIWRVRKLLNIFRERCIQFGIFTTAISIDEMMLKFYGRTILKQFIKAKPIRFGMKMWALCSSNGYLYDFDVYCGKNGDTATVLPKCAQGSRIVLQMLQRLFLNYSPRKLSQYHAYFDNLFCSPDLLVHLKKIGIQATGTVRKDRIDESNNIDAKAPRGTYGVKHDTNSGINFITVMDSKPVSVLSTSAGVTPISSVKRVDKSINQKVDLPFPNAFTTYNKFMGGVDIHDQHSNKVLPIVRSKKWTWIIFMRILQAAITNATVLYNTASNNVKKLTKKELILTVCEAYLNKSKVKPVLNHTWHSNQKQKYCSGSKCEVRTNKYCSDCKKYICKICFEKSHK